jgi:26S proteasome regulatory subunit N1
METEKAKTKPDKKGKKPGDPDSKEIDESELSEKDKLLKEKIDKLVALLIGSDPVQSDKAFVMLVDEVKNATTSMTSIPKPLKFINPHYESIIEFYKNLKSDRQGLK